MKNKVNKQEQGSVTLKFRNELKSQTKKGKLDVSNRFEQADKKYVEIDILPIGQVTGFLKSKSSQFQIRERRGNNIKSVHLKNRDNFRVNNKKATSIEFFKSSNNKDTQAHYVGQSKKDLIKINNLKFFSNNSQESTQKTQKNVQNVKEETAFNRTTNAFPKKDRFRLQNAGSNQNYSSLVYQKISLSASPGKMPRQLQKSQSIVNEAFQEAYRRLEPQIYFDNNDGLITIYTCTATESPNKRKKVQIRTMAEIKQQIKSDLTLKFRKRIPQPIIALSLQVQSDKIYKSKLESFVEFIFKLNLTNSILIEPSFKQLGNNFQKTKVYVGKGNNKNLLMALLKRRFWIQITNDIQDKNIRFFWTQNSLKQIHAKQQCKKAVKAQQFRSIQDQSIQKSQFTQDRNIIQNDSEVIWRKLKALPVQKKYLRAKAQNEKISKDPIFAIFMEKYIRNLSSNNKINSSYINQGQLSIAHIITNHLPNNSYITTKKGLFYTIQRYYRRVLLSDPFKVIPKTYHFTNDNMKAFKQFLSEYKFGVGKSNSIWIIKPGQCSNQGSGIFLKNISEISYHTIQEGSKYSPVKHSNGVLKTFIFQSYLTNPLLFHGRKFDIRHYMMATSVNGNLKAYWFADGYIRTSSQLFTLNNLNNRYVHLTNDAVQKHSQRYGKFEPFNKVSYGQFQRYLDTIYTNIKVDFQVQILSKMKQIATHVIKANAFNLNRNKKMNNFEIFGLDFMIDENLSCWLIEVNANPCLETSSPLLSRIVPILVQHSLRLGLDPLLFPSCHFPVNKRFFLSDKTLQSLKYQLIFDDSDQNTMKQLRLNKQKMENAFDDIQFNQPQDEYESEGNQMDPCKLNI